MDLSRILSNRIWGENPWMPGTVILDYPRPSPRETLIRDIKIYPDGYLRCTFEILWTPSSDVREIRVTETIKRRNHG